MNIDLKAKTEPETRTCRDHGEYESENVIGKIWTPCPECSKIRSRQDDERKRRELEEAWQRKMDRASIPERFRSRTLDSYKADTPDQKHALEFCLQYVDNLDEVLRTGQSVLFCGNPGTGKTHLAIGIAINALSDGRCSVIFTTVMKAIRSIKATWGRNSESTESEIMRKLSSVGILILDEVGVQFGSETEENLLFDIINTRYENCRPTIFISNLDAENVKKYLGERAFDRIREDGGKLIPFTWDSYRGRKTT